MNTRPNLVPTVEPADGPLKRHDVPVAEVHRSRVHRDEHLPIARCRNGPAMDSGTGVDAARRVFPSEPGW